MELRKLYVALCQARNETVPLEEAAHLLASCTGMSLVVVEALLKFDGVR